MAESKKKLTSERDSKELLRGASTLAVKLLIDTLSNEEAKLETRIDCAKRILDRVYGKEGMKPDPGEAQPVTFVLEGELHEYAK